MEFPEITLGVVMSDNAKVNWEIEIGPFSEKEWLTADKLQNKFLTHLNLYRAEFLILFDKVVLVLVDDFHYQSKHSGHRDIHTQIAGNRYL